MAHCFVRVVAAKARVKFTVSYTCDAVGDLARAVADLCQLESGSRSVVWDQEPTVVELLVERLGRDRAALTFVATDRRGGVLTSYLRFSVTFSAVANAPSSALSAVRPREYAELSSRHLVPNDALDNIRRAEAGRWPGGSAAT